MRFLRDCLITLLAACGTPQHGPDVTPTDPPTQQDYEPQPGGALRISWHDPHEPDFAQTMLVFYDNTPDGKPIRGQMPTAGSALGSGKVRYVGTGEAFLDTALPDLCRSYTYELWSQDFAGNWSVGPARLLVARGAGTQAPKVAPTAMTAAEVDGDVMLAWTNPPQSSGWSEVRVIRKYGSAPLSTTDGVAVYTGQASATAEPISGMGTGTWVYGVFACNGCGVCNKNAATVIFSRAVATDGGDDGGTGGGGGDDGGSLLTPTGLALQLSGDGKNVLLSWNNPAQVTGVKVQRTLNSEPLGPGDSNATQVFVGVATNASERVEKLAPNLANAPRTFHYRVYGCRNASCEATGAGATLALTVSQALRGGGYNLIWRHATATVCGDQTQLGPANNTTAPNWWKSCDNNCTTATARQLDTVQAPNEVSTIHNQFAARGFTIGRVISSEFCRAFQTAQGFNFGPPIEQSQVLTYFVYEEAQRCANTMTMLNAQPTSGTNTAMVSHAGLTCAIIDSLAWGEAAIYRPNSTGGPSFITRVPWNGWAGLP